MTREEFGIIMGYLVLGTGKELSIDAHEVYFDCLGDLDANTLQIAAKRVLMEHKWATFPSVAELRMAAALTVKNEVSSLSAIEAWEIGWRAIGRIDPDQDGSIERALKGIPDLVLRTIKAMGIANLVCGKDPVPVVRAQFIEAFERLQEREMREALLPDDTRKSIEEHGKGEAISAPVRLAIIGIGKEVG